MEQHEEIQYLRRKIKWSIYIFLMIMLAVLSACTQNESSNKVNKDQAVEREETSQNKSDTNFPITIEVDSEKVTVNKKPEKIAALSLNVAEIAIELTGTDRIAAVSSTIENGNLSHFSGESSEIKNHLAAATSLDPEEVLSYNPDLVLLTLTHGAEQDANQLLKNANVPVASFNNWGTIKNLQENYLKIGQMLGEEEKAKEIVKEIETKVEHASERVKAYKNKPTVLVLSQVGSTTGPYMIGQSSIAHDLVEIAGGINGSEKLGLEQTTPASIEHLIEMDPDYIILVAWSETSDEFKELVESPGFKELRAVKDGHMKEIVSKDISQANRHIVDTLDQLIDWIHEE